MLTGFQVGQTSNIPLTLSQKIQLFKNGNLKDDVMIKSRQLLFNLPK